MSRHDYHHTMGVRGRWFRVVGWVAVMVILLATPPLRADPEVARLLNEISDLPRTHTKPNSVPAAPLDGEPVEWDWARLRVPKAWRATIPFEHHTARVFWVEVDHRFVQVIFVQHEPAAQSLSRFHPQTLDAVKGAVADPAQYMRGFDSDLAFFAHCYNLTADDVLRTPDRDRYIAARLLRYVKHLNGVVSQNRMDFDNGTAFYGVRTPQARRRLDQPEDRHWLSFQIFDSDGKGQATGIMKIMIGQDDPAILHRVAQQCLATLEWIDR